MSPERFVKGESERTSTEASIPSSLVHYIIDIIIL
jgi:hypothetical protein